MRAWPTGQLDWLYDGGRVSSLILQSTQGKLWPRQNINPLIDISWILKNISVCCMATTHQDHPLHWPFPFNLPSRVTVLVLLLFAGLVSGLRRTPPTFLKDLNRSDSINLAIISTSVPTFPHWSLYEFGVYMNEEFILRVLSKLSSPPHVVFWNVQWPTEIPDEEHAYLALDFWNYRPKQSWKNLQSGDGLRGMIEE